MSNKLIIYKGVSGNGKIQFLEEEKDKYYKLTGATVIEIFFRKSDQEIFKKDLTNGVSIEDEGSGIINFTWTDTEADDLKLGNNLSFYAKIVKAGETVVIPFQHSLDVLELVTG
jgi:hypothetical protein